MDKVIIVVNPGSTSTKMALFKGKKCLSSDEVTHPSDQLAGYENVADQFDLRMSGINKWLEGQNIESREVAAVAGRGAPMRPLESGIYSINDKMLDDLKKMRYSNHASNLGPIIADFLGKKFSVPAIIVDPVTIDDFTEYARISGIPEIERKCRSHALNLREVCRREAIKLKKTIDDCNFIGVHMGGGISVAAIRKGKIIDVNDALLGMGPFSPDRAGALPIGALVKLAFSGKYTEAELIKKLSRESGLKAYLGEADLRKVEERIKGGDKKALLYFEAMAYQIAKEIGACSAVLRGKFDAIILTGGMAQSKLLIKKLKEHISYLGEVIVVPGEFEMEALVGGALRVLNKEESPKEY